MKFRFDTNFCSITVCLLIVSLYYYYPVTPYLQVIWGKFYIKHSLRDYACPCNICLLTGNSAVSAARECEVLAACEATATRSKVLRSRT